MVFCRVSGLSLRKKSSIIYNAALLSRCYTPLAFRPFINSKTNHKRHFIKLPFIKKKGIGFIDLHSIFKDRSIASFTKLLKLLLSKHKSSFRHLQRDVQVITESIVWFEQTRPSINCCCLTVILQLDFKAGTKQYYGLQKTPAEGNIEVNDHCSHS